MSAPQPGGDDRFWGNGLPFIGLRAVGQPTNTETFWGNGLPITFLTPTGQTSQFFMVFNGF